jgi:hypothetical protein
MIDSVSQFFRELSEDAVAYFCGREPWFLLLGDAYLYEIKHVNFLVSTAVGIFLEDCC